MLKKNKIIKIKVKNPKKIRLIKKPSVNCNLKIQIKSKDLIIKNKKALLKNLKKKYRLIIESQRYKSKHFNKTVVIKGPVCHSKSKESYTTVQTLDYINFTSKNLAQSLKFFIESDKIFLKKGSNRFKLSTTI